MIRALIAEDEPLTRGFLQQKVPELCPAVSIAAAVGNGREALDFLAENDVDLLITDIKMPVMDGLTLCAALRARNHRFPIIILSGYSEFEYAQKAIRYAVFGYVLKPITNSDLQKVLKDVTRKIDAEKELSHRTDVESRFLEEATRWLAAQYYQAVALNMEAEAQRIREMLPDGLAEPSYALLLFMPDFSRLFPEKDFDLGAINGRLVGMLRPVVERVDGLFFEGAALEYAVMLPLRQDQSLLAACRPFLGCLLQGEENFPHTVSAILVKDSARLAEKYRVALRMLKGSLIFPDRQSFLLQRDWEAALQWQPISGESLQRLGEVERILRMLSAAAYAGDRVLLRAYANRLWCFLRTELPQAQLPALLRNFCAVLFSAMMADMPLRFNRQAALDAMRRGLQQADSVETWQELPEAFLSPLAHCLGQPIAEESTSARKSTAHVLVDRAKDYINNRYAQQISLSIVAGWLGVSANYLSSLFQQVDQRTYMQYLLYVRMEHAAAMLTQNPDARVSAVAASVGYISDKHFIHAFKRYFGKTPTEFRGA